MTLQNKNVLITGAYGGLGKSISEEFLLSGNNVVLVGKNWEKLLELRVELEEKNKHRCNISSYVCDLNDDKSIYAMINSVKEDCKTIDVLVNCAGTFPISQLREMSLYEYRQCMKVNMEAPFILTQEFTKEMARQKWGRVINIASSSAYGGGAKTSVYCASKHALLGFSRSLFKELKDDGIRVFCISPGSIQTEMGKEVEKLGQIYDTFMTPEEVAQYILHVASYDGQMVSEEVRLNRVHVQ